MKGRTRGRRHRSSDEWRAILGQQAGSGLTVRQFCLREAICEQGFFRWRKRLGEQAPALRGKFVELKSSPAIESGVRVELRLTNGAILRIA